ncbi:prepilin-type N-terminal cleavage/methylation domain-containing protein [Candidatus Saccharibacteria bacterium]|nr:prepilin-type N-terminal cleavage/methylation domain-containing protein [Candidatus Saccharibacteria bacterium]
MKAKGYTVIEVLIVLAATGMLLTMATYLLKNQTGETTFLQSLRDIQSKIETVISSVNNSLFPNANNYTCSLQPGNDNVQRATLKAETSSGIGTNDDCLFLGKALGVVKDRDTLYVYSVLGGRTYQSGDQTLEAETFAQTNPTAAVVSGSDLTEVYNPSTGGLYLLSARYDGSDSTDVNLAGFYNDLTGSSADSQRLLAKAYATNINADGSKTEAAACIEEQPACQNFSLSHWLLCYQDAKRQRTAVLDIAASNAGVTTKLNFVDCQ